MLCPQRDHNSSRCSVHRPSSSMLQYHSSLSFAGFSSRLFIFSFSEIVLHRYTWPRGTESSGSRGWGLAHGHSIWLVYTNTWFSLSTNHSARKKKREKKRKQKKEPSRSTLPPHLIPPFLSLFFFFYPKTIRAPVF